MSGDWKNYFDARLGSLWEDYFPGLLTELGCETREDWHQNLPLRPELDEDNSIDPLLTPANVGLQAQLIKLQEANAELQRRLIQSCGADKS
jgi:hypothetical protein